MYQLIMNKNISGLYNERDRTLIVEASSEIEARNKAEVPAHKKQGCGNTLHPWKLEEYSSCIPLLKKGDPCPKDGEWVRYETREKFSFCKGDIFGGYREKNTTDNLFFGEELRAHWYQEL